MNIYARGHRRIPQSWQYVVPILLLAGLVLSGCGTSPSPTSVTKLAPTTTTTSAARSISAAQRYLKVISSQYLIALGRAAQALNSAQVLTPQSSAAYSQFENASLIFQGEVAAYHWPKVAEADARSLVRALSAIIADDQLAANYQPTPNFTLDNATQIADLRLLDADLNFEG